jgi:hypothetical protein
VARSFLTWFFVVYFVAGLALLGDVGAYAMYALYRLLA